VSFGITPGFDESLHSVAKQGDGKRGELIWKVLTISITSIDTYDAGYAGYEQ